MALQTNATKIANLFDPEVVGARLEKKLFKYIRFAPLADVDASLVGRAGDTLSLPFYNAIGSAEDVAEGGAIPVKKLTESTVDVKVAKVGIGVELTDEALLSGYGDPLGQSIDQMAKSIADKVDDKVLASLETIGTTPSGSSTAIGHKKQLTAAFVATDVADALVEFGEDLDGGVLIVDATGYATLRKAQSWIPSTEMGAEVIVSGVVGSIYGCQVVVSDKITTDYYIVKAGALGIILKRETAIESQRNIINKSTILTADKHFACYLKNADKAVRIAKKVG